MQDRPLGRIVAGRDRVPARYGTGVGWSFNLAGMSLIMSRTKIILEGASVPEKMLIRLVCFIWKPRSTHFESRWKEPLALGSVNGCLGAVAGL